MINWVSAEEQAYLYEINSHIQVDLKCYVGLTVIPANTLCLLSNPV